MNVLCRRVDNKKSVRLNRESLRGSTRRNFLCNSSWFFSKERKRKEREKRNKLG